MMGRIKKGTVGMPKSRKIATTCYDKTAERANERKSWMRRRASKHRPVVSVCRLGITRGSRERRSDTISSEPPMRSFFAVALSTWCARTCTG